MNLHDLVYKLEGLKYADGRRDLPVKILVPTAVGTLALDINDVAVAKMNDKEISIIISSMHLEPSEVKGGIENPGGDGE